MIIPTEPIRSIGKPLPLLQAIDQIHLAKPIEPPELLATVALVGHTAETHE